jgi:hypothetical protein
MIRLQCGRSGIWYEWNKASKGFHIPWEGANKFTYSCCEVFWDAVNQKIARGHTSDTAVDQIYEAYGWGKSICEILRLMAQGSKECIDCSI